jgi:hypothetical protein
VTRTATWLAVAGLRHAKNCDGSQAVHHCAAVVEWYQQQNRNGAQSMSHVIAPHETTYTAPKYATAGQVEFMEKIMARNGFYYGHFDRLWKLLEAHRTDLRTPGDGTRMDRDVASQTIDWLLRQEAAAKAKLQQARPSWQEASLLLPTVLDERRRAEQPVVAVPAQPAESKAPQAVAYGVYQKDGAVYIVVPNKAGTRTYAKKMVESAPRLTEHGEQADFEWEMAPGMIWKLTEADRMPLEDAHALVIKYGRCLKCRRTLKAFKTLQTAAETGRMLGPKCRLYFS